MGTHRARVFRARFVGRRGRASRARFVVPGLAARARVFRARFVVPGLAARARVVRVVVVRVVVVVDVVTDPIEFLLPVVVVVRSRVIILVDVFVALIAMTPGDDPHPSPPNILLSRIALLIAIAP